MVGAVEEYGCKSGGHDYALDEVSGGCSKEAAQSCISKDDYGRDQHGYVVVHTEESREELAAGRETGGGVGDEEDDDNESGYEP